MENNLSWNEKVTNNLLKEKIKISRKKIQQDNTMQLIIISLITINIPF